MEEAVQTEYLVLLPPLEQPSEGIVDVDPDLLAQFLDQDEEITVFWPFVEIIDDDSGCDTTIQTSVRFIGLEEFGQKVDLEAGFLTFETFSPELQKLTSDQE